MDSCRDWCNRVQPNKEKMKISFRLRETNL